MNWIELTEAEQVKKISHDSKADPARTFVIFKHSTRCSTSRMALRFFENGWNETVPAYKINVVENRPASNEAVGLFQVGHESPQVLVIRNGACIYNASHAEIDPVIVAGLN